MNPGFKMVRLDRLNAQAAKLPDSVFNQLKKSLRLLSVNARHPSLRTHIVRAHRGAYGGPIFEAYLNEQYRLTFEHAAEKQIVLRNVDNHDECLRKP